MKDKTYRFVFFVVFITGVGFCIGGIWIPDLLVPGGALVTGALGMYSQVILALIKNPAGRLRSSSLPTDPEASPRAPAPLTLKYKTSDGSDKKPHASSTLTFTKRLSWLDGAGHHTRTTEMTKLEERISGSELDRGSNASEGSAYYSAVDGVAEGPAPERRSPRHVLTID